MMREKNFLGISNVRCSSVSSGVRRKSLLLRRSAASHMNRCEHKERAQMHDCASERLQQRAHTHCLSLRRACSRSLICGASGGMLLFEAVAFTLHSFELV